MSMLEILRNRSAELITFLRDLAALAVVLAVAFAAIAVAGYLTSGTVTWEKEEASVASVAGETGRHVS